MAASYQPTYQVKVFIIIRERSDIEKHLIIDYKKMRQHVS